MAQINKESSSVVGRKPDFTGEGVAVWVNTVNKEGKHKGEQYLSVKILGQITVNAFKPNATNTKEVQPEKAATPNKCKHESYTEEGACKSCGKDYYEIIGGITPKTSFTFQCVRCNKEVSEMFAFGVNGDTCICKDCWHNNTLVEEDEEETDKYSLSIDEGVNVQQTINEVNE